VGGQIHNTAALPQGKGTGDHLIESWQLPELPFMI